MRKRGHDAQALPGKVARAIQLSFAMKAVFPCARLSALSVACLSAFGVSAFAQDVTLKETVVTAARVAQPLADVVADVSVIHREQIESAAGRTLSELLVREAGVQMSSNGGLGKSSNVYLRGANSGHVLLLIDGVRYGSATLGAANWDNIPLELVERIEVLKGPAAALYGSDAMGGVVQVFTRQGQKGFYPHASVTLGANSHRQVAAGVSGGTDEVSYALAASSLTEKGFSATNSRIGSSYNSDRDGFDQDSVNSSLTWRPAPGWRLSLHATQANGVNRSDSGASAFDVRTNSVTQVFGSGLEYQWSEGVSTSLKLSRSEDKSTYFRTASSTTLNETQRTQSTLQQEWRSAVGTWVFGVDAIKESVESTSTFALTERSTNALFLGLNGQKQGHLWQLNLRHDDNSQFGVATTGSIAYGYQFSPEWSLKGGYGTTFRAPSFNNLYTNTTSAGIQYQGNPLLEPEKGRSKELALVYNSSAGPIKLTRFDSRIVNLIDWAYISPTIRRASNINLVDISGWSIGYEGGSGLWYWNTQIELLDAKDAKTGLKLPQRADQQFKASLQRELANWKLGAHWLTASGRYTDASNTESKRLAGYSTLDLSAEHALNSEWRVQFRLNNLANKTYETVYGYNQPGRAAYVTLRWQGK